ncbi:HD domain-containing protein [Dokdonella sp.]|uniref:HD domain-containing protein n=1 Tax=Dokdonella sp. TaxID=2291710 RepID=UPI003529377D
MTAITKRFTDALDYARIAHAAQFRKGSNIPDLYHLLGVASLVIEHGGNEDQAIAGLLHDVIEDCGEPHRALVRQQFGGAVAKIVDDCTDGSAEQKKAHSDAEAKRQDWTRRKLDYLSHLAKADDTTLLVSGCDKLHNARAILVDLENPEVGEEVFKRFTGGKQGTLSYYHSLAETFTRRKTPMAPQMEQVVARIHELAKASKRRGFTGD